MKILVLGGMHGNERLGIELVEMFGRDPFVNVDAAVANPPAVARSERFIDFDLNRSFPGDLQSPQFEQRRAAEVLELARDYDLVFDFHNTGTRGNDCCFVGENCDEVLFGVAELVGLDNVIVADYDCVNKYANNCISIEISEVSVRNSPNDWYQSIVAIGDMSQIQLPRGQDTRRYRFVKRISLDDRDRLDLTNVLLKPFEQIPPEIARQLGVSCTSQAIFVADPYTPYSYGGVIEPLTTQ